MSFAFIQELFHERDLTSYVRAALSVGDRVQLIRMGHAQRLDPATTSLATALSVREIYDKLHAAGYDQIREIGWSNSRYKAEVWSSKGHDITLYVNAYTGELERRKTRR